MPAIKSGLVLVTGGSGYIAAHICSQLLALKFQVRATVRSNSKGEYLKALFNSSAFSYVIVEDIEVAGAFDEACKGTVAVAHIASPFHFNVTDPHVDLINPAVNGTLNLLESALKSSATIERVVFTSSFASVFYPTEKKDYIFSEKDWNEFSPIQVEKLGVKVDGINAYRASKVLAEKAAWKWMEEHKSAFELCAINPPLVFGPLIHQCASPDSLNTSVAAFYNYLTGKKSDQDAQAASGSFVDVRDVAQLHIECLTNSTAANERYLVSTDSFHYQPFLDVLHKPEHASTLASFPKCIRGIPGSAKPLQPSITTQKAQDMFNWKAIPMEKTIIDMANSLAERQKEWNT